MFVKGNEYKYYVLFIVWCKYKGLVECYGYIIEIWLFIWGLGGGCVGENFDIG